MSGGRQGKAARSGLWDVAALWKRGSKFASKRGQLGGVMETLRPGEKEGKKESIGLKRAGKLVPQ